MTDAPDKNVLAHVGILGMKWGVRRGDSSGGSGSGGSKSGSGRSDPDNPEVSSDYLRARINKRKKAKELSDADIQKVLSRMQLERQFKEINQTTVDRGKAVAKKMLIQFGGQVASQIVTKASGVAAEKLWTVLAPAITKGIGK